MNIAPPKIIRPQLSRVYKRKRLFRSLDSALKARAVWITSPPGAGKTTLVNSYLEDKKLRCVWYTVDASDIDLPSFFHYLGGASDALLSGALLSNKRIPHLPHLKPEHAAGIAAFTRQFFEDFFLRSDKPFVLVFDNAQEASHDRGFAEAIRIAIESLPPGFKIIFISRTAPPPLLARSMVNRDLKAIEWKDLKFDEAESIGLLQTLGHKKRTGDLAIKIHALAGGWASGLLLMSDRVDFSDKFSGVNTAGRSVELVFNYFMEEILHNVDKTDRAFLVKSSILPEMTVKAAAELTGCLEAGDLLSRLNGRNFFTERAHDNKDVYRYHPLFRDFLLSTLAAEYDSRTILSLKAKAGALLEKQGDINNAAMLYMDARRWNELVGLIKKEARTLARQGRYALLEGWLNVLPQDIFGSEPWAQYWSGICVMQASPVKARAIFEAAYRQFRGLDDDAGLFLSWCGVVNTYLYEWRDFKPLDLWIKEMKDIVRTTKAFPSKEIEETLYSTMFGALTFRQPFNQDMHEWEERVANIARSSKDVNMRFCASKDLIIFCVYNGYIARAGIIVSAVLPALIERMDSGEIDLAKLMCLRATAVYHTYVAKPEVTLELADKGLYYAGKIGIRVLDTIFNGTKIYGHVFLNNIADAEACLMKIEHGLNEEQCYDKLYHQHMLSVIAAYKKDKDDAVYHGRIQFELAEATGSPLTRLIHAYFYAGALLLACKYDELEEFLDRIKKSEGAAVMKINNNYATFIHVFDAHLAFIKGDSAGFAKAQKRVADFPAENITLLYFIVFQRTNGITPRLCLAALNAGIEVEKMREIIKLNRMDPPEAEDAMSCEQWPWPVKIQTFGRFAIYKDDKKITFERKAQKKPLDLLKALVALGGTDVSVDKLCDELWPDSEGDAAVKALRTNIHRLRQLIGDNALLCVGSAISLNPAICRVDALMFGRLASNAQRWLGSSTNEREVLQAIDNALEAYGRGFLPDDDDMPCIAAERERLRRKYQRITELIAGYHDKKGDSHMAVSYYEKAFEAHKADERLCRQLMQIYGRLKMQSKAGSAYKKLEAALKEESGGSVSQETVQTYKAATSGK